MSFTHKFAHSQQYPNLKSNIQIIPDKIADYTNIGECKYSIILSRIRHRCSSLKADLFSVNIIQSPVCSCGTPSESTEHYFFECHLYTSLRNNLMHYLHTRLHINDVNIAVLTTGSQNYDDNKNKSIIQSTIKFIKDTHRFEENT